MADFGEEINHEGTKIKFCTMFHEDVCIFSDVDVERPDEKSIITYVSSLYEQFPEVPSVEQSLKDNVSRLGQF